MSELHFKYGAMKSGKSTALINRAYGLRENNIPIAVTKPSIDTKGDRSVVARKGLSLEVDFLTTPELNIRDYVRSIGEAALKLRTLLVDEAQFLQPEQVDQLLEIAKIDNIPVIAYGLRTDFRSHTFPGSQRLLEIADTLDGLQATCRCGDDAHYNTRKVNDIYVFEGDQVAIDGTGDISYTSLCGQCYLTEKAKAVA